MFEKRRLLAAATAGILLLWIWLIVVYVLRSNTALFWQPGRYTFGVFSALFDRYTFSLTNSPLGEVVQTLIVSALTLAFGLQLVRALGFRLPLAAHLALAYAIGFGTSGIAFLLLTLARGLYPIPVWLTWIALLGAGWYAAHRLGTSEPQAAQSWLPETWPGRVAWGAMMVLVLLINGAIFWHAVFLPETYWDSLILYLGYARMTFFEHAFPFKAEGQVGIGLGANYPHLFSTYGAMASMAFGHWTDLHQRFAAPLAGLASCALVYETVRRTTGLALAAAAATLVFRAVPHGIAYSTYASDYAFAILFMAAFCLLVRLYVERPSTRNLAALALLNACAMQLNFLMGILWLPYGLLVLARFWQGPKWSLLLAITLLGSVASSPWYIRNWVLTGNPVYAFFPEIFRGSVRVNPEVMESAKLEWFRNGDGVGSLAEAYHDYRTGIERPVSDPAFRRAATLRDRIDASWAFWIGYDYLRLTNGKITKAPLYVRLAHLFRVHRSSESVEGEPFLGSSALTWRHSYKYAPLIPAFLFPGLLLFLGLLILRGTPGDQLLTIGIVSLLAIGLLGYFYILADFYSYQIVGIVAPAGVVAGFLIAWLHSILPRSPAWKAFVYAPVLIAGLVPGLTFALMNFRFFSGEVQGQRFDQLALDAFRNPGMPPELVYRIRYGADVDMWDHLAKVLPEGRLLTHENRHYVLPPALVCVHLDDWDMQAAYDWNNPARLYEYLQSQRITHYLRVPNEFNHPVNARLGMEQFEAAGYLREVFRAGDNVLFAIVNPPAKD